MRNKPRIRFKGFTEDWEQRKLLTVLNKIVDYRGRTPKKLGLDWSSTGHLALSALNVKMGYIDKTVDAHYGDEYLYSVWMKDNDLYEGQVLFTTEAPMGNVAQVPDDNKYILSQRTIAFVPDRSVISDNFLAVVLSASKCQKSLTNRASGGTAKGVSQKTLSEISLDIPQSFSEQDKVSELIKKLSKVITLHQRKLEKLKLAKKALLQKLFPKNGSQFPEIRFKGFTDAWEQRKFDEIMTFINGRAYKQDELLSDGKYKVLRVGNFYTNDSWYYSNLELDDKYYAMNGDLLYTWSATFGPHIWKGEKVIYHYHIWKIVLKNKIDKLFALQLLEVDKANIMSDKNGSTMVHITKQGMENKKTILPLSLNEQKQISKFLSSIDKLITLHQRKLDKLQDVKKGLLQKMFV